MNPCVTDTMNYITYFLYFLERNTNNFDFIPRENILYKRHLLKDKERVINLLIYCKNQ